MDPVVFSPRPVPNVTWPAGDMLRGDTVSAHGRFVYMKIARGGHEFAYSWSSDGSLTQLPENLARRLWRWLIGSGSTELSADGN